MSNMPELGDTSKDGSWKVSQSVEVDPIDADAPKEAQGVHAKDLRTDYHSC